MWLPGNLCLMPIAARWLDSLKALSLVHGKHLVYEGRRFSRPFSAWPVGRDKPSTSLHGPSFRDWANILDLYKYKIRFLHLYCYPPMKWWTKLWLRCLKLAIAFGGALVFCIIWYSLKGFSNQQIIQVVGDEILEAKEGSILQPWTENGLFLSFHTDS